MAHPRALALLVVLLAACGDTPDYVAPGTTPVSQVGADAICNEVNAFDRERWRPEHTLLACTVLKSVYGEEVCHEEVAICVEESGSSPAVCPTCFERCVASAVPLCDATVDELLACKTAEADAWDAYLTQADCATPSGWPDPPERDVKEGQTPACRALPRACLLAAGVVHPIGLTTAFVEENGEPLQVVRWDGDVRIDGDIADVDVALTVADGRTLTVRYTAPSLTRIYPDSPDLPMAQASFGDTPCTLGLSDVSPHHLNTLFQCGDTLVEASLRLPQG